MWLSGSIYIAASNPKASSLEVQRLNWCNIDIMAFKHFLLVAIPVLHISGFNFSCRQSGLTVLGKIMPTSCHI